jgi:methylated-DNA-[protein]-cysteine S-methyltransferase
MSNCEIFIDYMQTPIGMLEIRADGQGVSRVGFVEQEQSPVANPLTDMAKVQLGEYFDGQRQAFDLPLSIQGTDFQRQVWQRLLEVPFGQTDSYQSIALQINNPKAVRAVGSANGKNKIAIVIPCHRIIGANGTLTGYAGGLDRKSWLLEWEQKAHNR